MAINQLALIPLVLALSAVQQSTQAAEQALRSATGRALQGDATDAVALLEQVPASEFGEKDRAIRACIIERFRSSPEEEQSSRIGTVTDKALSLYRSYWRASLLRPETRAARDEQLLKELRTLLALPADAGSERVEAELRQRVAAEGNHVLMGRTPPLLEFMVWGSETSDVHQVPLPEGRHSIQVKILDDFVSLGWSAYATCERSFTGGWVKPDAIYAVGPGWTDLMAENFQVSFLAHEAQHFSDKQRFGELESWELEYRAKLAELALADATLPRILSAFISNQGADPSVPHSYANRIVLSWLTSELDVDDPAALANMPGETIRGAAKSLLFRDSASRRAVVIPRPSG
jgi:hypothetical protein